MAKIFPEPLVRLTFRQAVEDAKRAIREKGWDFVYESSPGITCHNFELDGTPSCVVGHIVNYEGLQLEDILGVKDDFWEEEIDFNYAGISTMTRHGVLEADEEAIMFLAKMQTRQDEGETWGMSYTEALRCVYSRRKFNV